MKILLLHSFLFIQFFGYASCLEVDFVLKKDTVIPDWEDQSLTGPSQMPTYPGGDSQLVKDLNANLVYPKLEKSKGIQGIVFVQFYVEKDGSISEVKVARGIKDGENLDKEAVETVKKLKNFTPAKNHKGEAVRTMLTLPVRFKLPKETDVKQNNKP